MVATARWLSGALRLETLLRLPADVRHAARSLTRQPRFTAVVALTLGVGVGAAGAVFALTNALLLRGPEGVPDPDGAAFVMFGTSERPSQGISGPAAEEIRRSATLLDGLATYETGLARVVVEGVRPVDIRASAVYGDYFELLGVRAAAGRLLGADETGPDAEPRVAVISEQLARQLFGEPSRAVGRQIELDRQLLTVLGVAGFGFRGTVRSWQADVWLPISSNRNGYPPDRFWSAQSRPLQFFIARPRIGADARGIEGQINQILDRLFDGDAEGHSYLRELRASVHPGLMSPFERQRVEGTLEILSAGALLLLLVTCANVANLLIVRGVYRRHDVALARALGASGGRIARERLAESFVLAMLGVTVGVALAWLISATFRGVSLFGLPEFQGLELEPVVIAFAAAAVLVTAALFGTLPAVLASRFDVSSTLREEGTQTTARSGLVRYGISVVQIALSLTLLIGSALLVRSVRNLYAVDIGIKLEGVHVHTFDLTSGTPREGPELDALYQRMLNAVEAVHGAHLPALNSHYGPYQSALRYRIVPVERSGEEAVAARVNWVTSNWFELLGVPVITGRTLTAADAGSGPLRAVLTAALATRLFGSTDVVGRTVRVGIRAFEEAEIVGVVGDVRLMTLDGPPDETFFLPRAPAGLGGAVTLLFRTDAPEVAAAVHRELEAALPEMPVELPTPLAGRIDLGLVEQRLFAKVLTLFSTLAVVLAAVGLFGVVSFAVAQRRREFGIRIALGADGARLRSLVLRAAGVIVVLGIGAGVIVASTLSRLIEARLFGVDAADLSSYLGAAALMGIVALVACWIPAREALGTNPVDALRAE
jgi:predicted permease